MGLLDLAFADKIRKNSDKLKLDQEKAEKQLQATKINSAILDLAKQSGNQEEIEATSKVLESIGNTDPDVSKIIYGSIENRIKDKLNFQQNLQTEGLKAKMSFIPEITKSMAASGKYSPEQIQEFAGLATEKAQAGIAGRINQATSAQGQPQQPQQVSETSKDGVAGDIFSNPLPEKKSQKMREKERTMNQGREVITSLRDKFIEIDDKYGVGRIGGQVTGIRGALGDLLPKDKQAPEVAVYDGLLDGAAVFIGKNVWNDDRVAVDDRKAYKKSIAKLSNTREEGELMFNALEEFSKTDDPKLQTALQLMIPQKGDGASLSPSQALVEQGLLTVAVNKKTGEKMYQDKKTKKWRPLPNKKK